MSGERHPLSLRRLLKPYTGMLTLGVAAIVVESAATLAEPWPLKVVLDNVLKSKGGHGWLTQVIFSFAGTDKLAILQFAALAVLAIAAVGAAASYTEKYITTSLGQWVMHDLRHTLYSHIQRLSLGFHDRQTDRRPDQPPDQRHRCHPELHHLGPAGGADQQPDAGRHGGRHVLPEPAVHADRAFGGAVAVRGGLPLHAPHQKGHARRAEKGRRDGLGDPGSAVVHARGEGVRARGVRAAAAGRGEPRIDRDRAPGARPEGQAVAHGGSDHRGGNLPGAVVRRPHGARRDRSAPVRWCSSSGISAGCTSRCGSFRR